MKQNDWTRQLYDRLDNHKTAVPDGLWDNIERQLDAKRKPKGRRVVLRAASWMAAAASVALLVVGGFYTNRHAVAPVSAPLAGVRGVAQNAEKGAPVAASGSSGELLALVDGGGNGASAATSASAGSQEDLALAAADAALGAAVVQGVGEESPVEAVSAPVPDTEKAASATAKTETRSGGRHPSAVANIVPGGGYVHRATAKSSSRWSVGAHTGNAFAESRNTQGAVPIVRFCASSDRTPDETVFNAYPLLFANYKEVKHHNQPLAVGVSVSYAINNRLALSTGLVYTRVTSDFIQQAGSDEIVDNQRLHYVGVPLGVSYNVWSNRSVRTYATVGAQVDFNVKATLDTEGVSSDINKDRPQVSGTAGVGVEYDIVPQVGVYAEPGVRYYFNNHSAVDNIFKSQPWAFNLQVGVRINVK